MAPNSLAHKAHNITHATALASESPRRWANVFAYVYCGLLSEADRARLEEESRLVGLDLERVELLARLGGESDDECLAETIRAFGAREPSLVDAEVWLARTKAMLGLDDEGRTVLEP
jgi:hypothetical protein